MELYVKTTCTACDRPNFVYLGHEWSDDVEAFRCWACDKIQWLGPDQDPDDRDQTTPEERYQVGEHLTGEAP